MNLLAFSCFRGEKRETACYGVIVPQHFSLCLSAFLSHKSFFCYLVSSCCPSLCCSSSKNTHHIFTSLRHTVNPHGERPDSPITTPPLAKSKQTLTLSKCGLIVFNINRPCKTLGRRTSREGLPLKSPPPFSSLQMFSCQCWLRFEESRHWCVYVCNVIFLKWCLSHLDFFFWQSQLLLSKQPERQHLALTLGFYKGNWKSHLCPLKLPFVC